MYICDCTCFFVFRLLTFGMWLPATVVDRINNAVLGHCLWEPSLNPEYVYMVAILGYHGPCVLMIGCYVCVLIQMHKKAKLIPKRKNETPQSMHRNVFRSAQLRENLTPELSRKSRYQTQGQITREKKIFVTLTYILCGYLACWLPFHVVFDVIAIDPTCVPGSVLKLTYWLAYMNSTINPILYNYSNPDFRRAFKMILRKNIAVSIEPNRSTPESKCNG